jgi:hypothetical protein
MMEGDVKPNKEVVVPTPRNKSPNEGHGLEKSISRTSSLSNSPNEEDLDKFHEGIPPAHPEEPYYERRPPHPQQETAYHPHPPPKAYAKQPPPLHYPNQQPPNQYDEISPSTSTISTKDTQGHFFGMMKPKHPVHLKSGREMAAEEGEAKRLKTEVKKDQDSPANASDFGDIGAMPSWDRNMSGWSVCSGMTGMESLMNKDLAGNGVLSAFSFSSEMSKKEKKEEVVDSNPSAADEVSPTEKSKAKKKQGHVQFSQSFDGPHHGSRKRMHDGRSAMPPPSRYRRPPPPSHEEYPLYPPAPPSEMPPPVPSHPYEYTPPPPRFRRDYEDDPYYDYPYPPSRYYDYRYRPPPYPYRPPQEYEYPAVPPRGPPTSSARVPPALIHSSDVRAPICGSWEKEDDMALMDIMKKQKNVKNWDPIAKKLNRGKRFVWLFDGSCDLT